MKSSAHHLKGIFAGVLLVIYAAFPVLADDTEIFLGTGSVSTGVQPNVLFILDNSGSMNSSAKDADGNYTGQTRLEAMKEAFSEIMATTNGVNIGLMRFNAPGGSILLPIQDINAEIPLEPFSVSPEILASTDDAVELHDTDGTVILDSETYDFVYTDNPNASGTVSITIDSASDNEEENGSGSIQNCCTEWNIRSDYTNGLRFQNVEIPPGATITNATITLTSRSNYSGTSTTQWFGEDNPNPDAFSLDDDDITDRSRIQDGGSDLSVTWTMNSWSYENQYTSPDLTSIVQEMVNNAGWVSGNSMVFIQEMTSGISRASRLVTGSGQWYAPQLDITYATGAAAQIYQTVGLRFQNVNIPQGATVTSAQISFYAAETNASAASFDIQIERSADAEAFAASNGNLRNAVDRPKYPSTPATWTVDGTWTADQPEPGPDVTALVQEVVSNVTGWCGNNAMAFYISGSSSDLRTAYAFDAGEDREPKLTVSYTYDPDTAPAGTGCTNEYLANRVALRENDAEQSSSGSVYNSSSTIDMYSGRTNGFRFESLPIAQGATILEAYIEFTSRYSDTGSVTFHLDGHAHDNSPAFPQENYNISSRTKTSSGLTVDWDITEAWSSNTVYQTPDISDIIEAIVGRSGWNAGNALSILQTASGSSYDRRTYSFDSSAADAPRLVIKVADGGVDYSNNTVRQHADSLVQNLEGRTYTPITDSLYEAALYFRGDPVYYGTTRERFTPLSGNVPKRYKRVSDIESHTATSSDHNIPSGCNLDYPDSSSCENESFSGSPSYISPITSDCQSSHIVLLTDGEANNNHSASSSANADGLTLIQSMTGASSCTSSSSSQYCARELVTYLSSEDQMPSFTATDNIINTHTIAFNLDSSSARTFLEDLATNGGGSYYTASTASDLANTFQQIIQTIVSKDTTFVSPGATVNQFNRLTHRSEIYFSLFKPESTPKWPGNLKRYKILGDPPVISDANDAEAIDTDSGFFKSTAKSVWSSSVDGSSVELGGAAHEVPEPASRKVYTYLSGASSPSKTLTNSVNKLHEDNSEITTGMLGVADSSTRAKVLAWARGVDNKDNDGDSFYTDKRTQMGDPLHSVPALVTYGGTDENPDITIYVATNEGFLHAIDGDDGSEYFSFIPEDLLGNLDLFYDNTSLFSTVRYGLDGSPIVWVNDADQDAEISGSDHVYLYVGMRRGGRNYYALDVTNRNTPKVLWTIKGGTVGDDFEYLGQTWSTPVKTKIKIGTTTKDVLIFGGGYDTSEDTLTKRSDSSATMGNAIYIVDAETGDRLWWASSHAAAANGLELSDMDYPIPSEVSVTDINSDGLADQMFVADLGGQVWRFDINNGESSVGDLVSGGLIADLADNTEEGYRKFFYKPSISLLAHDGILSLGIALGSGNRPVPATDRTTENRFFMLYDYNIFNAPDNYVSVTDADLTDRTGEHDSDPISYDGWYLDLVREGEKVLANAITVDNKVFFTTFEPNVAPNACTAVAGSGHVFVLNAINGNAAMDLNDDGTIDADDKEKLLGSGAIPPSPKILFPEGSSPTILIGPEQLDPQMAQPDWEPIYWYENWN